MQHVPVIREWKSGGNLWAARDFSLKTARAKISYPFRGEAWAVDVGQTVNQEWTAAAALLNAGIGVLECWLNIFAAETRKKSALIINSVCQLSWCWWATGLQLELCGRWDSVPLLLIQNWDWNVKGYVLIMFYQVPAVERISCSSIASVFTVNTAALAWLCQNQEIFSMTLVIHWCLFKGKGCVLFMPATQMLLVTPGFEKKRQIECILGLYSWSTTQLWVCLLNQCGYKY